MTKQDQRKKIVNLLERLLKNERRAYVTMSATGTIYAEAFGEKVRIADHLPNQRNSDKYIYTHDACGTLINDPFQVLVKVAKFWELEITGALKASLTKHLKSN